MQCQGKGRIRYPQEMVEFVHYAERKIKASKRRRRKKRLHKNIKSFKRIETQAEGFEHSSAIFYEEKGTEI